MHSRQDASRFTIENFQRRSPRPEGSARSLPAGFISGVIRPERVVQRLGKRAKALGHEDVGNAVGIEVVEEEWWEVVHVGSRTQCLTFPEGPSLLQDLG